MNYPLLKKALATCAMAFAIVSGTIDNSMAQNLVAGDLAFTGFDASPNTTAVAPNPVDRFSFVLLTPIPNGTLIYFTDRGYFGSGGWQPSNVSSEGVISWTSSGALATGTEVMISLGAGVTTTINGVPNGTSAVVSGRPGSGMSLGNFGDQIIAFQGGNGEPSLGTAIAGIHFSQLGTNNTTTTTVAGWDLSTTPGPINSQVPPGLTGGTNAFWLGFSGNYNDFYKQGSFNKATVISPKTPANIRAALMDVANWTRSISSTPGVVPIPSGVDLSACTAPSITGNPPNRTICTNGSTTFSATATGATSYKWQVDQTGSGTFSDLSDVAPYSGTTTLTLTITGATAGMNGYRYRAVALNGASCSSNSNNGILSVSSITTTGAQTNVACFGGANGVASVAATGGAGSYTYSWSPVGGNNQTATGLREGTYTVTITDAIGCTATRTFNISQPASAISVTPGAQNNISCFGGSNGTASINLPTGGTPGYTYDWAPGTPTGDGTRSVSGLSAGIWTVTVTDANGCSSVQSFDITQPAELNATSVVTDVSCNGGSDGSIDLTPTGGTGSYIYLWNDGVTTQDRTGLAPGSYSVTITDGNACNRTLMGIMVNQPATISASATITNIACNGGATGAITIMPTGGTAPYTYNWGNGITSKDRSGLSAGNYSVTVTDANLCTRVLNFTVNQIAPLNLSTQVYQVSCNGGSNGAIDLTPTGGTAPYTYSWTGGRTTQDLSGLQAGSYSVTVTDSYGCTSTLSDIVVSQPALLSAVSTVTGVSCNGGGNGQISITPSGGTAPYTYDWGGGFTVQNRTGLPAGTYSVAITDARGCRVSLNGITVGQPALLSLTGSKTDVLCNGSFTGTASVVAAGGTPGYTYMWAPSGGTAATASGLAPGTYTVTVTDANLCQATQSFTVGSPSALTATSSQINATCSTPGQASVTPSGGAGSYTYLWSPSGATTQAVTGLLAGNHSCVITDANGCSITKNFIISTTNTLVATQSQTDLLCNGSNTGSASVVPSGAPGPFTYAWSPSGGNAATATGLSAGNYSVTITAANGCAIVKNFTIAQPSALSVVSSQTNVSCDGGANGSASVTVSGGTGAYTYQWLPSGGTAASASGLSAGNYTVTIKDANLCQTTKNITITSPDRLVATIASKSDVSCNGGSNGSATVNVTGGSGVYSYQWLPSGGTGMTATGLSAGNYTVIVRDANLCQTTQSVTIGQPASVELSAASLSGGNVGAAYTSALNATGGSGNFAYSIISGALPGGLSISSAGVISGTPTQAGNYNFIIRATEDGCSQSASLPYAINIASGSQTITFNAPTGKIFGALPFQLNAVSSSGLAVSYVSSNPSVATISGTTVTIVGAGTTNITASQAGDANYGPALQVSQQLVVAKANATINLSSPAYAYDGQPKNASVTTQPAGLSGISITYNGASTIPSAAGSYAVVASLNNANYSAADATGTMVIAAQNQTIAFAPLAPKIYGDAPITLNATGGGSGNTVGFASSDASVATVSGNTLSIVGAGTVNITASQAGNANYAAALPAVQTLQISPKQIAGAFTASDKEYDGTTVATVATRTLTGVLASDAGQVNLSGGAASFAEPTAGNGKTVTATGMVLTGAKAPNYALSATSSTTANIAPRPINLVADGKTKVYGEADPALSYQLAIGSLIGSDVLAGALARTPGNAVGSYPILIGTMDAGSNYRIVFAGANLEVVPKMLTVTADSKTRPFSAANPTFTLSYSGFVGAENASSLSVVPMVSTTATISSPAGNYPIVPSGASASNYAFTYVNGTLSIVSTTQSITFEALADKLSTDAPFVLGATASSGLPVAYTSSDTRIARVISGNQLEVLSPGTVTITASQAGNANYLAATSVSRQLRVIENPAPVINITSSRGASISKGETSVLTATGAASYVWSNASGILSGQNSASLSIRPSVSTVYTVTGTNQYGRSSTASFAIEVRSDFLALKATNVMTPNGDGVNDLWIVENIDLYPENQVTIVDRAGRAVLKVKGYKNNWDATLNGLPLEQGTYYYVIDFGRGFGIQKGFISVVRGK